MSAFVKAGPLTALDVTWSKRAAFHQQLMGDAMIAEDRPCGLSECPSGSGLRFCYCLRRSS